MTDKTDAPANDPKAASLQQSSDSAVDDARRAQPPVPKDASAKEKINHVIDGWIQDIRSNANPITRAQEASNFLFEQAPSLKAALSKAL